MSNQIPIQPFFTIKHRALGFLWAWGLTNMALGAGMALSRNQVIRHIGFQALVWGAIDAALAFAGRRDALAAPERGDDPGAVAGRDQTILLINAGLDVGYIATGCWLIRTANNRAERFGMGAGIVAQGVFLLGLDSALGWLFGRWKKRTGAAA
jgi:hypothetical protein